MFGFIKKKRSPLAEVRELQKARAVLLLPVECTVEDVRASFSKQVKAVHPDAGGVINAVYDLDELRRAKDILIREMETGDA